MLTVQIVLFDRFDPELAGIVLVPGASGDVEGDVMSSIPAILARAMNTQLTGIVGQTLGQKDKAKPRGQ